MTTPALGPTETVSVSRKTDESGSEIDIDLAPADDASMYTSNAVKSGYEIDVDVWSGQTLKRGGDDDLGTPQEATVYTNIDPATEQLLRLGDADTAVMLGANDVLVLDPREDVATINDEVMEMDTFGATYNGIPGMFTCGAGAVECAMIETTTLTGGQIIITNSFELLAGGHLNPTTLSKHMRRKTPTICILGIGCSHRIPLMVKWYTSSLPSSVLWIMSSMWNPYLRTMPATP